jgi:gamma-glutamyltranspeptidase/glutathione hydrolase
MAVDLAKGGSRITAEDFAAYEVLESTPLIGRHRGTDLHTAGPTSGGQRLIDMLAHVAAHLTPRTSPDVESWKIYADGLNLAWRTHRRRIGLVTEPGGCTSHLAAVDAQGNMAAMTFTLLNRFGSGVVLPSCGVLMNNAISYFDPRSGHPTSLATRKRINASNMCPVIATKDGTARFAIGASGANQIMPAVAQIAGMMLDFDLSLESAFNHPRLDASDRADIRADPRLGETVLTALAGDFELELAQRLVFPKLYGCPTGVSRNPATGLCHGINDPSQPIGGAAAPAPFQLEAGPSHHRPIVRA